MKDSNLKQKNIELLAGMLDNLNTKSQMTDFVKAFELAITYLKEQKSLNQSELKNLREMFNQAILEAKTTNFEQFNTLKARILADISEKLSKIKDGTDGKNGKDGISPDKNIIVNEVKSSLINLIPKIDQIEQDLPKLGEKIRDSLELLQGNNRLDASAIKNLPSTVSKFVSSEIDLNIMRHRALSSLADVDVSGIAVGQSIKWDGVRWIPYTPAGGTTTSVYNEVVAGATQTFTLAHTPSLGTERVYALGQRQIPTTNYTIAGAVITTIDSWSAGQITADYTY